MLKYLFAYRKCVFTNERTKKRELILNQDFFHLEFGRAEPDLVGNPVAATTS